MVYPVVKTKGVSDEKLEEIRQENLERDKNIVENVRKNKGAILDELHTKLVILNNWQNELIVQVKAIKRSKFQLRFEANLSKPKLEIPGPNLTIDQVIENAFSYMRGYDPMKQKRIISDAEWESLISWVNSYFAHEHTLPEINRPIKKIYTSRGNVVTTFKNLYKEIHPKGFFPDSLFNLIKACFYEYREDKIENMRKTKEPDHYQELIRKSE